jgi:hypothetical protein
MITKFDTFLNEEAAPKIPNNIQYWMSKYKQKIGKDVMIYTHNDLDGIFSAIAVKLYLEKNGFNILGYGVLDYEEGWNIIKLKEDVINIALDYAEYNKDVDIYMDHHGNFTDADNVSNKDKAVKTKTGSAYEGIMDQLGLPVDALTLSVIDMVDSAKYDDYGVKWTDILDFDLAEIIKKKNAKMVFASAFNQLIKRGDYKTIIEVIYNAKNVSIYQIFSLFKKLYPMNNIWTKGRSKGQGKDFIEDAKWRLDTMKSKTRGKGYEKKIYLTQSDFFKDNWADKKINFDGYVIINNLVFVPSGTWANALRARAIVEQDMESGIIPKEANVKFILLQYGNSLQLCSYKKMNLFNEDEYPILKNGEKVKNIGKYTEDLLENFKKHLNYNYSKTLAGGHEGIGNLSNIVGECFKYGNIKFLDIFKNKIISDLSGAKWDGINMSWNNNEEKEHDFEASEINQKVLLVNQLNKITI